MAQGAAKTQKKSSILSGGAAKKRNSMSKRGANLQIAPKKAALAKRREMVRKHTGALVAMTEIQLGAKAGHLELVKAGKKLAKEKENRAKLAKAGGKSGAKS